MRFPSILALVLVGCSAATATVPTPTTPPAAPPADPMEALHPHCVARLVAGEARVALEACREAVGRLSMEGNWRTFLPTMEGEPGRALERFELLGPYGAGYALRYLVNGGGTGDFTGVLVVAFEGGELVRREAFAQGDRCNGGLVRARIHGAAIEATQSITPADVIDASELGRGLHLVPYQHLEASASSCAAQATYRWVNGEATLIEVTFPEALTDQPGWTSNFTHQSCFNGLVATRVGAGRGVMSPSELEVFAQELAVRCLTPSEPPR